MATVNTSGDPITITYEIPVSKALEFRTGVIDLFDMDPSSTNQQVADRIAQEIREAIRERRRAVASRDAYDTAEALDPGTVDFT